MIYDFFAWIIVLNLLELLEWTLKIPTQKFIYERINTQGTMLAMCLALLTGEEKRNFMLKINREYMLELTRRMTVSRTAMTRIVGCYMDKDGFVDGTFNTNFLKLSSADKAKNLSIAKAIPFSETNKNLKRYQFTGRDSVKMRQLLLGLKSCAFKNDALLDTFYDLVAEKCHFTYDYAVIFFHGTYDIPVKGTDKESLWDSEEVYEYLICAICPVTGDYEAGVPEFGFIFPAFCDRTEDPDYIDIYEKYSERPHSELYHLLGLK